MSTTRSLRVLIVDDSEDTVTTCGELLKLYGHECRLAQSGNEALAVLDGWEPDIALLDIRMPGMSGNELARRICERATGKPLLVAITGVGGEVARLEAQEAGFDRFFVKPVDPHVITNLLRDYAATLESSEE